MDKKFIYKDFDTQMNKRFEYVVGIQVIIR